MACCREGIANGANLAKGGALLGWGSSCATPFLYFFGALWRRVVSSTLMGVEDVDAIVERTATLGTRH